MSALVEMVLYHGLDVTGSIEVSVTASSGPWTKLTLSSAKRIEDALEEWEDLANAALPAGAWAFAIEGAGVRFRATTPPGWVKLSRTLADLLGFSGVLVVAGAGSGAGEVSDETALGLLSPVAIGRNQPRAVEAAESEEFRMGRAATLHHSRRQEVTLELYLAEEDAETLLESPIISGHAAFSVVIDDASDYSETNLDGRLLVYPKHTPSIEASEGTGNEVVVTILGTLEGG